MDMNGYLAEFLTHRHLEDLRAAAQRHELARQARRPLRWTLGRVLVSLGTRLQRDWSPARVSA
jgi:hypothetical protein